MGLLHCHVHWLRDLEDTQTRCVGRHMTGCSENVEPEMSTTKKSPVGQSRLQQGIELV